MPRDTCTVKFPRPPVPRPSPSLRWSLQRIPADRATTAGWEEVGGGSGDGSGAWVELAAGAPGVRPLDLLRVVAGGKAVAHGFAREDGRAVRLRNLTALPGLGLQALLLLGQYVEDWAGAWARVDDACLAELATSAGVDRRALARLACAWAGDAADVVEPGGGERTDVLARALAVLDGRGDPAALADLVDASDPGKRPSHLHAAAAVVEAAGPPMRAQHLAATARGAAMEAALGPRPPRGAHRLTAAEEATLRGTLKAQADALRAAVPLGAVLLAGTAPAGEGP